MKNYLLLFILTFALGTICAQERSSYINKKFDHFTIDILDNLYGWRGDILEKYSPNGELTASYSDRSLGSISHVDASIPSKILVFYQETGTILLLDNKLTPVGNILNIFDKDLFSVSLAAISNPNSISLYDFSSQSLIISDFDLNITHSTPCNFSKNFSPNHISTLLDNKILLSDPSGLYFFDKFGSFERHIAIPNITSSQLSKNAIYYLLNNKIHKYDTLSLEISIIPTEIEDIKEFYISNSFLYILDISGTIYKYRIRK